MSRQAQIKVLYPFLVTGIFHNDSWGAMNEIFDWCNNHVSDWWIVNDGIRFPTEQDAALFSLRWL